jgi:hypothetical protein
MRVAVGLAWPHLEFFECLAWAPKFKLETEKPELALTPKIDKKIYRTIFSFNDFRAHTLEARNSISCNVALGEPNKTPVKARIH